MAVLLVVAPPWIVFKHKVNRIIRQLVRAMLSFCAGRAAIPSATVSLSSSALSSNLFGVYHVPGPFSCFLLRRCFSAASAVAT